MDTSNDLTDQHVKDGAPVEVTAHAERLVAGVQSHEWAKVRVSRRVVTEERTITVPVRREEIVVEYLDGAQASDAATAGDADQVTSRVVEEFVLHEEVPRVELDTVAREKVQVVVDSHRRLVNVTDQVAREHIEVVGDDGLTVHGLDDAAPRR